MTFDDLIKQARADEARHQRTMDGLAAEVRAIAAKARAAGRDHLTSTEDTYVRRCQDRYAEAQAHRDAARAHAGDLGDAHGQELATDRLMERSAPVPGMSGGPVRDSVHRLGLAADPAGTSDPGAPVWRYRNDGRPATVARGGRFADHDAVRDEAARREAADRQVAGQYGSLGRLMRTMSTSTGAAIIPQTWLGDIIDRARNLSAVFRAGAELVPMPTKQVNIGRLTGDPTAAFRTEGSTITASDPTFDNVTLDAKTMSALVIGNLEWWQDADGAEEIVEEALAKAFAIRLDLVALMGGITTGGDAAVLPGGGLPSPPNPRGLLAALLADAPTSVLGNQANGTAPTAATVWNEVLDTIWLPRTFNEEPTALIWPPKLAQFFAKLYDTATQPMQQPPDVAAINKFMTNQVPSGVTQGTGTTMADLFVGDFRQMLIGQRLDVMIQTLDQRYAENGQIGVVAHFRGDVALARPRAFAAYRYLKGAA